MFDKPRGLHFEGVRTCDLERCLGVGNVNLGTWEAVAVECGLTGEGVETDLGLMENGRAASDPERLWQETPACRGSGGLGGYFLCWLLRAGWGENE